MLHVPLLLLGGGAFLAGVKSLWRQELPDDPSTQKHAVPTLLEDLQTLGSELQSKTLEVFTRTHAVIQEQAALILGEERVQQMQDLRASQASATDSPPLGANAEGRDTTKANEQANEQADVEKEIDHQFLVASTGTALAVTGLLTHTALGVLSIPFTLYTCIPLLKVVYKGLVEEKRLRGPVIDLVAVGASLSAHYYVLTAASCTLMCVAEKVVYRTQDRSRRDMVSIFQQQNPLVWTLRQGVEVQVPLADLQVGDTVVVAAGGVIPVDGVITLGEASIDQHMLTGESQPVERGVGDPVLAATLVLTGRIQLRVEKTGDATITAQIGAVMSEIEDYRERQELRCDETADSLVLPTLAGGAFTLARLGLRSAVTVVGCNFTETLRIAYPLGALSYLNRAAQQGILVKDGRALEMLSKVDTVVFDKTGTLTLEQPHVAVVHPCAELSEERILTYAAAAEFRQSHPIARAILEAAEQRQLPLPPITEAAYAVGYGIQVRVSRLGQPDSLNDTVHVRVGSARYMLQEGIALPQTILDLQHRCHSQGHSVVYVALEDQLAGALELHATLRPEVQTLVQQLKKRNLSLYILSGDQTHPTRHLADALGMDGYFAEVLPTDKARYVERLQKEGRKVCFIGDGINDAIALKQADVSISLRGATTVATDIAQVVLMDQSLVQLDHLFDLSHQLDANLKRSFAAMIIPSSLNLAGALFFHLGIRSAIVLFNVSLLGGVVNGLAPALMGRAKEKGVNAETVAPKSSTLESLPLAVERSTAIPTFPQLKRLEVQDQAEIDGFVRQFPPYSQLSFTALFAYDFMDDTMISWLHGNLVVRLQDFHTMDYFYSFLGTHQVADTIEQLLQQAELEQITPELLIVAEHCLLPEWDALHERFDIQEDDACFDYILSVDHLSQLAENAQNAKTRDLHKFLRNYPQATVQPLDLCHPEIKAQILHLFHTWAIRRQKQQEDIQVEQTAVERILRIADQLSLVSLGVYLNGTLAGFTINEVVQDGYYIGHFGKADPDCRGLGMFLEQETAKVMAQFGCTRMNYEEDLGLPGLRAYKKSLGPIGYLKKFTIARRGMEQEGEQETDEG